MGALDRQVRNEAVTMRANVFGHNYKDETEYDLTAGAFTVSGGYSDLCNMLGVSKSDGSKITPTPSDINAIRILQPHQGELVECYIDFFSIRSATDIGGSTVEKGGMQMFVAIGDFTNNNFTTPRTSYTLDEIIDSHERITGRRTPFYMASGGGDWRIHASRVNLLPELIKAGSSRFVEDGFNLLLVFVSDNWPDAGYRLMTPTGGGAGSNFAFEFFRVVQSMTGVR